MMLDRRRFVGSMAAVAATTFTPLRASAAVTQKSTLPARREFVLRNAYVMTMDPELNDIPGGDVHIKNGVIVAVGKGLKTPGAAVLDGQRMIVLPGLVDTHWHMWNTLLRSMSGGSRPGDGPGPGYFRVCVGLGRAFGPG